MSDSAPVRPHYAGRAQAVFDALAKHYGERLACLGDRDELLRVCATAAEAAHGAPLDAPAGRLTAQDLADARARWKLAEADLSSAARMLELGSSWTYGVIVGDLPKLLAEIEALRQEISK